MQRNWITHILLVSTQDGTANLATVWQFLIKLNMQLPYDPAVTFLGI